MQGAEDQRQLGHPVTPSEPHPGGPRVPSPCLIPTRPNVPTSGRSPVSLHHTAPQHSHLLPPNHLPSVPTSVPMASTTKSADLPTWPVSKPGPQARTFCAPASGLTCTSKGLDTEGASVNVEKCPHQKSPSSLPAESQAAGSLLPPCRAQTGRQGCTVLTCGGWRSRPM